MVEEWTMVGRRRIWYPQMLEGELGPQQPQPEMNVRSRDTQEKMDGGKDGGSEAGRAPTDEKERSGGVREYRGKITDFYVYTTKLKDGLRDGR